MSRTLTHASDLRSAHTPAPAGLHRPGDVIAGIDTVGRSVLGTVHKVALRPDGAHGGATYVLKPGALVAPAYTSLETWDYVDADRVNNADDGTV